MCVFVLNSYFHSKYLDLFRCIEIAMVSIFILEYALRLWIADYKIRHVFHFYSIVDLVAIIPTFITFLDFRFIRIIRVFRIFRFMRFIDTGTFLTKEAKLHDVRILKIVFTLVLIIFVFSSFIPKWVNTQPLATDINHLGRLKIMKIHVDGVYFQASFRNNSI